MSVSGHRHVPLRFDAGTLLLKGAGKTNPNEATGGIPWQWDPRVAAWRCDARHYPDLAPAILAGNLPLDDQVPAWQPIHWPQVNVRQLRPEQIKAVSAWLAARRGCVIMPTGTGKTEVALEIMRQTAVSTLVVAPVRDLMYQWHRRILESLGYDAGIVGDNTFRVQPVSVTTYDSACIHMEKFGDRFGLIVFDECHHLPGAMRRDAAAQSAAPFRLGLTATPERGDGRHVDLNWLIGPTLYELPLSEVRGASLAEYDVVRVPVHLSEEEQTRYDLLSRDLRDYFVKRTQDDKSFTWEKLCREMMHSPEARRMNRAFRAKVAIEDRAEEKLRILEDLFRLHAGEPVLVFVGSNAMARDVSVRFLVPCLLSHTRKEERLDYLRGLESGVYPVLVANQVLDEGVDLPEVKTAIVIGGQASTRQARQRLGRILRRSGNARAVLYEVVCVETGDEDRSRQRRSHDAYSGTRTRRI